MFQKNRVKNLILDRFTDIPLVGLPITVVSCNYAGHEYLHHDVNNLSPSWEFDIEANKMTLIDLSRCILFVCIIRRLVMP